MERDVIELDVVEHWIRPCLRLAVRHEVLQRHRLREPVGHVAGERPRACRLDIDIDQPTDQSQWGVKHHNPIAHRPARELHDLLRGGGTGIVCPSH